MDNLTQLALMTKAQLVFESPDTFLCFPALEPLSYPPEQLDFSQMSGQSTPVFPEFCQLTNAIPQGVLYPTSLDSYLWEKYDFVLQNAETAQSTLTPQETADLQKALAFLYVQAPDGTRVDSTAVVAYQQYRQAWLLAMQNYASQKSTAEASSDPSVQAQWQNVDEPRLRAEVQAAADAWTAQGFKSQVESAQQVEQACAAKSPALQWENWRNAFNPDIDVQTWPSTGVSYALTAYSPYDILDQPNWPTFTLTDAEIGQLANEAPPELKNILDPGTAGPSVSSLSFEFCSVTLNRTWFDPALFDARFWRLPDPTIQLSDGKSPPQGQCPAYISGLVFARNIVVTPQSDTGTAPPTPLHIFPPITLRPVVVGLVPPRTPVPGRILPEPVGMPVRALPETVKPAAALATMPETSAVARDDMVAQPPPAAVISSSIMARLNLGTFKTLPLGPIGLPPAPPQTEPTPSPSGGGQPQPSSNVSILAFICRPLPKCPDPDPTLNWGP